MKIYNSISTKTFTTYAFLILVIKTIIITTNVSAQECDIITAPKNPTDLSQKFHIVGFLRQQSDLSKIKWDTYTDIAYAANDFNSPPPSGGDGTNKLPTATPDDGFIKNLVKLTKGRPKDFNLMLAMGGNYGDDDWNKIFTNPAYSDKVVKFLNTYDFDGVDVEYPKQCKLVDQMTSFATFITTLEQKLPQGKFITVTAGPNDQAILTRISQDTVKWVNIIGYRLNIGLYNPVEGPTSPFDDPNNNQFLTFKKVAENWKAQNPAYSANFMMMGIEPSGIVRKVQTFTDSQVVTSVKDLLTFDNGAPITGLCNDPLNYMRSVQWIDLQKNPSIFENYCVTNSSWTRTFDNATKSTYLRNDNSGIYISYEDLESLYYKVSFIKNAAVGDQFGGIMISDISADLNGDFLSIISYIRSNEPMPSITHPTSSANPANTSSTNPNSSSTSTGTDKSTSTSTSDSPTTSTYSSDLTGPHINTTGIIVGSVIGAFAAVIIGFSLLWYFGYKKRQSMALNKPVNSNDYQNVSVPVSIIDKAVPDTPVSRVTALYDFEGKETTDLSFKKGDIIEVIEKGDGANDWWVGKIGSKIGEFPGNYVRE